MNLNPLHRGEKLLLSGFVEEGLRVVTSSPDALTVDDYQVATNLTIAGAVALTGPSNAGIGTLLRIYDQKGDAGTNNITFTPYAGETVEGGATLVINVNYGCVQIEKESATNWKVLSRSYATSGALDLSNVAGNLTFSKESAHTISVGATTTAATAGGAMSLAAGAGNTTGTGGAFSAAGGAGGNDGVGGAMNLAGGAAGGGNRNGGAMNIDGGAKSGSGTDGAINIGATRGAVNISKSGGTVGFFAVTAAVRQPAITQTYATTSTTHANLTLADLTDNSGGTAADTVAAITTGGAAADQAPTRNAIATLVREQARAKADVANVKQVLNTAIDYLQTYGLFQ